eukprot:TRINITY_DN12355_c0_g1_i1.p1 TRINITY_DN12355_c0_g1~~TRINITY_DN12355_c0_g1_i1.p1  ORF type:complete len:496 (+),score=122.66 TRINITY_DN12355_c0_g1_i1:65-1552(+)
MCIRDSKRSLVVAHHKKSASFVSDIRAEGSEDQEIIVINNDYKYDPRENEGSFHLAEDAGRDAGKSKHKSRRRRDFKSYFWGSRANITLDESKDLESSQIRGSSKGNNSSVVLMSKSLAKVSKGRTHSFLSPGPPESTVRATMESVRSPDSATSKDVKLTLNFGSPIPAGKTKKEFLRTFRKKFTDDVRQKTANGRKESSRTRIPREIKENICSNLASGRSNTRKKTGKLSGKGNILVQLTPPQETSPKRILETPAMIGQSCQGIAITTLPNDKQTKGKGLPPVLSQAQIVSSTILGEERPTEGGSRTNDSLFDSGQFRIGVEAAARESKSGGRLFSYVCPPRQETEAERQFADSNGARRREDELQRQVNELKTVIQQKDERISLLNEKIVVLEQRMRNFEAIAEGTKAQGNDRSIQENLLEINRKVSALSTLLVNFDNRPSCEGSPDAGSNRLAKLLELSRAFQSNRQNEEVRGFDSLTPVSYTHLTLPTIYSV